MKVLGTGKHPRRLIIGALSLVAVGVVVAGPFVLGWESHDPQRHGFKLGEYATWLQGALTPLVILIALVTLLLQQKSLESTIEAQIDANRAQRKANNAQTETNRAQLDTNKKMLMGIMLDNIDRFHGHLN